MESVPAYTRTTPRARHTPIIPAMKFLTVEESGDWLARTPLGGVPDRLHPGEENLSLEIFPAHTTSFFARALYQWVVERAQNADVLVFVTEYGIWSSAQDHLYAVLRRAHNDHEGVEETPGHLASASEAEDAKAVIFLALVAGWGFVIAAQGCPRSAHVDHDGIVCLCDASSPTPVDVRAVLAIK